MTVPGGLAEGLAERVEQAGVLVVVVRRRDVGCDAAESFRVQRGQDMLVLGGLCGHLGGGKRGVRLDGPQVDVVVGLCRRLRGRSARRQWPPKLGCRP